jgi:hypothetical protein
MSVKRGFQVSEHSPTSERLLGYQCLYYGSCFVSVRLCAIGVCWNAMIGPAISYREISNRPVYSNRNPGYLGYKKLAFLSVSHCF